MDFLTDLEEKLDVAQVQLEMLQALERELMEPTAEQQRKLHELSNGLMTVTEVRTRCSNAATPLKFP